MTHATQDIPRPRREAPANCLLNLAKPGGQTSRDVVDRVCRVVGTKSVGHAGTLDPMATGVLVVAVGKATRLVENVQRLPKTYVATFRLGQSSDTDDAEGEVTDVAGAVPAEEEAVRAALAGFVGRIEQTPPAYSAVKVAGRRAYDLARKGQPLELKPRPVQVYGIDLLAYSWPELRLEIRCGSGTYIRSIARDLGAKLGVGGLMSALERTAIGHFTLAAAVPVRELEADPANWLAKSLPLDAAVEGLPVADVNQRHRNDFLSGRAFPWKPPGERGALDGAEVVVRHGLGPAGTFLGLATFDAGRGILQPSKGGFL